MLKGHLCLSHGHSHRHLTSRTGASREAGHCAGLQRHLPRGMVELRVLKPLPADLTVLEG